MKPETLAKKIEKANAKTAWTCKKHKWIGKCSLCESEHQKIRVAKKAEKANAKLIAKEAEHAAWIADMAEQDARYAKEATIQQPVKLTKTKTLYADYLVELNGKSMSRKSKKDIAQAIQRGIDDEINAELWPDKERFDVGQIMAGPWKP